MPLQHRPQPIGQILRSHSGALPPACLDIEHVLPSLILRSRDEKTRRVFGFSPTPGRKALVLGRRSRRRHGFFGRFSERSRSTAGSPRRISPKISHLFPGSPTPTPSLPTWPHP